ncbi:MAG: hypothetical protein KME26_23315 [Oscillatoria princeps RMCB-10]|jgi:hypothetical protein|nr:hypothetical protein [Oscillatoria princeps RMCB-10]
MKAPEFQNIFARIKQGDKSAALQKEIDSLLIQLQSSKDNLNAFTAAMSDSDMASILKYLWDDTSLQRWDLASTGGVANITPIFGYLWLMVAAEQTKQKGKYTRVVPKISTDGKGGGTIDILASGGLTFTSDPAAIKRKCLESGGTICQQDDALTPIDKALMARRRETNLMTNVYLTYASILSKKIAMRCTHAIVDVKLGKDTKILSAWMNDLAEVKVNDFLTAFKHKTEKNGLDIVLSDRNSLGIFSRVLQELGVETKTFIDEKENIGWLIQDCQNSNPKLDPLQEVRWLLTNANIPQCRAIGRHLILLHLDGLILDETELLMRDGDNEYKRLYRQILPRICDCQMEDPDATWEKLKAQCKILKSCLPKIDNLAAQNYLRDDYLELEKRHRLESASGQPLFDLAMISFGLYPYQWLVANQTVKIKSMNVQFLDELFSWLCGNEPYDSEVGIWLHKLPGEKVEIPVDGNAVGQDGKRYLKLCNKSQQPIISIFYRPSRCSESEVMAKARQFLCSVKV